MVRKLMFIAMVVLGVRNANADSTNLKALLAPTPWEVSSSTLITEGEQAGNWIVTVKSSTGVKEFQFDSGMIDRICRGFDKHDWYRGLERRYAPAEITGQILRYEISEGPLEWNRLTVSYQTDQIVRFVEPILVQEMAKSLAQLSLPRFDGWDRLVISRFMEYFFAETDGYEVRVRTMAISIETISDGKVKLERSPVKEWLKKYPNAQGGAYFHLTQGKYRTDINISSKGVKFLSNEEK